MLHLISVTGKSEVFFNVSGDNQQHRLHMGDCDGNFEIGKINDDATTIKVKVESYTLSATRDFIHAMARGGSRAAAISMMERFMIIVNGWKLLTIITKRSILDVAAALDPPLMAIILAAHYAFNVAYASKAFGAMYFMQKYLLEVDDEIKSPSKV